MTARIIFTRNDLDQLTRTLWGECRGEHRDGQIGVAWVVRNRAERPSWWGQTIAEVCRHPWQFSCWNPGPYADKLKALSTDDPEYTALYQVACDVLLGEVPDPTKGASHYERTGSGATWALGQIPSAVIGAHSFYALGPKA